MNVIANFSRKYILNLKSLLIIPRNVSDFLVYAYSKKYEQELQAENLTKKIYEFPNRIQALLEEIGKISNEVFRINSNKLANDFKKINNISLEKDNVKPICFYFVSDSDHNGAILGNHLYYYHHYKINHLQKHYNVQAMVVHSVGDIRNALSKFKQANPERPIKLVNMVSQGDDKCILIYNDFNPVYTKEDILNEKRNRIEPLFESCDSKASIIIDACSGGVGNRSFAKTLAQANPGCKVYAPGDLLCFSKPTFKQDKNDEVKIENIVNGLAFLFPHRYKQFKYLNGNQVKSHYKESILASIISSVTMLATAYVGGLYFGASYLLMAIPSVLLGIAVKTVTDEIHNYLDANKAVRSKKQEKTIPANKPHFESCLNRKPGFTPHYSAVGRSAEVITPERGANSIESQNSHSFLQQIRSWSAHR